MVRAIVALFIVALFIVVTIGINARLWRRHKALAATRPAWNDAAFLSALEEEGVERKVSAVVLAELRLFYMAGLSPHPDDELEQMLRIDPDDLVDIVETAVAALQQPMPRSGSPEHLPPFKTVGDVTRWVDMRLKRFAAMERIRSLASAFSADFKFDREEANARGLE